VQGDETEEQRNTGDESEAGEDGVRRQREEPGRARHRDEKDGESNDAE
jgi:hypothetical protein